MNQKISTGLGTAILLVMAFTAGYFVWMVEKNNQQPVSTSLVATTKKISKTDTVMPAKNDAKDAVIKLVIPESKEIADWQTYRNEEYGFEIKYPTGFGVFPHRIPTFFDETIGFNTTILYIQAVPKSSDARWGITIYDGYQNSDAAIEKIISRLGAQWGRGNRRSEQRTALTVNELPAIFVTIRTSSEEDWVLKSIILNNTGKIFEITNGAVEDPEFDQFFSSFKFLN